MQLKPLVILPHIENKTQIVRLFTSTLNCYKLAVRASLRYLAAYDAGRLFVAERDCYHTDVFPAFRDFHFFEEVHALGRDTQFLRD